VTEIHSDPQRRVGGSPPEPSFPAVIISGGQTGADRGALDFAIARGLPHAGFCPKGRKAEGGPIPARYRLTETGSADYPDRTRRNVEAADATTIFARTPAAVAAVGEGIPALQQVLSHGH